MPTVNQIVPADYPFDPLTQLAEAAGIDGASPRHQSSTGFIWGQTDAIGSGQHSIRPGSIIVQGNGLTYGGDGIANGGTVTSISISLGGTVSGGTAFASSPSVEFTGLSMNLADLGDELYSTLVGSTLPLETYFKGLTWTYNGSNGEDAFTGGRHADTINGNDGDDSLHGRRGADKLYGGGGDDTLYGAAGGDLLSGGDGFDTASYDDTIGAAVIANLADPSINTGDAAGDTYQSIEALYGTIYADTLYGDADDNRLVGWKGNDRLQGGGGNDTLSGMTEDDLLIGGSGGDKLDGGDGSDTASYAGSAAGVTVDLRNDAASGGDADGDTLISIENLTGSGWADSLTGDKGDNVLDDGGGTGVDTLRGRDGNDTYRIGNSGTVIVEAVGDGSDRVLASVGYVLKAGVWVEVMRTDLDSGKTAIDLTGNAFNQSIFGNAGRNMLDGKGGNDVLEGMGGKDFFTFSTALGANNIDTVLDFNAAADTVRLQNAIFTALTATGALAPGLFRANSTGTAVDGDDFILYGTDDGRLYYDADGSGTGARIHFATLAGAPAVTNADFVVV